MYVFKHWQAALFVFYLCMVAPTVFACEARLDLANTPGFVSKGKLGKSNEYIQRVYSGDRMSFSTLVFPRNVEFIKKRTFQKTAQNMVKSVLNRTKNLKPKVNVLNESLLPQIDPRLAFLSYVKYGSDLSINIEASSVVKIDKCWAILRYTALAKNTKEEALNYFATLIRSTTLH